jgi:hypothetical protein
MLPASMARPIAQAVGFTERATQRLIRDLDEAGYITRKRVGRHNEYVIHRDQLMTGDVVGEVPVSALIDCLDWSKGQTQTRERSNAHDQAAG